MPFASSRPADHLLHWRRSFLVTFERQWRDYLTQLNRPDPTEDGLPGRAMTSAEIEALSDEQKVQLMKIIESIETESPDPK
jgi:hypothetical protein